MLEPACSPNDVSFTWGPEFSYLLQTRQALSKTATTVEKYIAQKPRIGSAKNTQMIHNPRRAKVAQHPARKKLERQGTSGGFGERISGIVTKSHCRGRWPINQPTNQSNNKPINRSINQSINQMPIDFKRRKTPVDTFRIPQRHRRRTSRTAGARMNTAGYGPGLDPSPPFSSVDPSPRREVSRGISKLDFCAPK